MNKEEREYLADKCWTIVAEWNNWCIVSSYNTYHTIFFMQSLWWHLKNLQDPHVPQEPSHSERLQNFPQTPF